MKKIQLFGLVSLFLTQFAFASGDFAFDEMHESAKVGVLWYLQQSGKSAEQIKGYAVGQQGDGAKLRVFFKDGSQGNLFCHFHDHGHDLSEIDCHIL